MRSLRKLIRAPTNRKSDEFKPTLAYRDVSLRHANYSIETCPRFKKENVFDERRDGGREKCERRYPGKLREVELFLLNFAFLSKCKIYSGASRFEFKCRRTTTR